MPTDAIALAALHGADEDVGAGAVLIAIVVVVSAIGLWRALPRVREHGWESLLRVPGRGGAVRGGLHIVGVWVVSLAALVFGVILIAAPRRTETLDVSGRYVTHAAHANGTFNYHVRTANHGSFGADEDTYDQLQRPGTYTCRVTAYLVHDIIGCS